MSVRIHCGDCREIVPTLGKFAMTFLDPPFGIGQQYADYRDVGGDPLLEQLLPQALEVCRDATDGVLVLHGPDDLAEVYLREAARFGMRRVAWILWHYRFGQCGRGNWIHSHEHCLVYATHRDFTWRPEAVLVPSDRAAVYGDTRVGDYANGGQRLPFTVWGVAGDGDCDYWGRVQGNSKERRSGHPNQLPEVYMARLVNAYTDPRDRILDAFSGSGTLPTVAHALGRHCDAVDVSRASCESIARRVREGAVRVGPQAKRPAK
jgi:predicted RNA methylase